jgi:hypothetical protein
VTTTIPLSDLESGPSAKWKNIGDTYKGRILAMEKRQQTDPKDGSPKFFASGDPMPVWVITIEVADGERVALYASGGNYKIEEGEGQAMLPAIAQAVRAAGGEAVDVGAELAVSFTGWGEARSGLNRPRLFSAQYRPATPSVAVSDLFSQ